jgi:NIPSNAP protein
MIKRIVSADVTPGQDKAAEAWMLKAAAFINKKFPSANAHFQRNMSGPANRAHYVTTFDSLGAYEAFDKAFEADPEWQPVADEIEGLFVPDSFQVSFYRILT